MITGFLAFLFIYLFTVLPTGFFASTIIYKHKASLNLTLPIVIILGFGLSPFLLSLFLYYTLLIFKVNNYLVLLIAYFVIQTSLFLFFKNDSKSFFKEIKSFFKSFFKPAIYTNHSFNLLNDRYAKANEFLNPKIRKIIVWLTFIKINVAKILFLFLIFLLTKFQINKITTKPIFGHDMLEYAVQAGVFFKEKHIEFVKDRYDKETNFYYVGLHGYSYPLLGTWEKIVNDTLGVGKDYFFKSITAFYAMLLLLLIIVVLKNFDFYFALFSAFLVFISYGYFLMFTEYHIDTYRIFPVSVSFLLIANYFKTKQNMFWYLASVFIGFQAFSHSLGVFLAVIMFGILGLSFLLSKKWNLKLFVSSAILVLLFGGVHYLLDVFFGTGWIFQSIKFY